MTNSIATLGYAAKNGIVIAGFSQQIVVTEPETPIEPTPEPETPVKTTGGGGGIIYPPIQITDYETFRFVIQITWIEKIRFRLSIYRNSLEKTKFATKISVNSPFCKQLKTTLQIAKSVKYHALMTISTSKQLARVFPTSLHVKSQSKPAVTCKIRRCYLLKPEELAALIDTDG